MKKIVLLLAITLFLFSCSKDDKFDVRYEFSSDVAANYKIEYAVSNDASKIETITGTSWSKSVTMKRSSSSLYSFATASLTVYAPAAWATTSDKANTTLKIIVNGEEKESADTLITGASISQGVSIATTF